MASSQAINTASTEAARQILMRACGSTRWVDRMMQRRPFGNDARLLFAARNEWFGLTEADWLEAFSHHPRIGDRASLAARFPATHDLSAKEQARVGGADADVIAALAEANEAVLQSFWIYFHRLRHRQDRRGDAGAAAVEIAQRSLRRTADRRGRTGADHRASVELTAPPVARSRRRSVVTSQDRRGHPETDRRA